jgi:ribonuclease J
MGYMPVGDSQYFKVKFFGLTHSIPDSTGVIIQTPLGGILNTGDVRVENTDGVPVLQEQEQYAFLKDEKILLASIDSTGIEKMGWGISEGTVQKTVDTIIQNTTGRLLIASFASQVERLISFIESAKKYGKYIAFEGRSMKTNMGIVKELQLTDFSHVIPLEEIDEYPANKVIIVLTGGQGEEFSALSRIASDTHKSIQLRKEDTVLLSSSIIPGNDFAVAQLKNNLYRGSYNVITYNDNAVHASGHGRHDELKWVHEQVPYKFFMPVHGDPYMIRLHAKMAIEELKVPEENLAVADNGNIFEIRNNGDVLVKLEQKIPANVTIIDGAYMGPLHKVVMDDRKALSEDGMFIAVVTIDTKTGQLKKSPDIVSRGFIYLRESKDLLNKVRAVIKRAVETYVRAHPQGDFEDIKNVLAEHISKYLLQTTHKEPIVIPVVLGV